MNMQAWAYQSSSVPTRSFSTGPPHASAAEKAALWPKLVAMYPDYDQYQARTERVIPVLILDPR